MRPSIRLGTSIMAVMASATIVIQAATQEVSMNLAGKKFGHGKSLVASSGSKKTIFPSKIYQYKITGTIRGKDGALGAIYPKEVPLATFLQSIDTNNDDTASLLDGSFENPNGGLGVTLATKTIKGSRNVKGLGKVSVQLKFTALIDAKGQLSLQITKINAKAKGAPLSGVLVFGKGSKIVVSTAPIVEFKASGQKTVSESDGTVDIIVWRQGNKKGAATVDYATADATAVAGTDYESTSGTISFAPNEVEKIISVPLIDNAEKDGYRTFTVTLSNLSTGAVLGTKTTTTAGIANDD